MLVMLIITIAGAAAILSGRLLARRIAAMPSVENHNAAYEAEWLKHPHLIFALSRLT